MFEFNLCKRVNSDFIIDVSFKVDAEKISAIIGRSGAGKSTILNLISGVISLDSGFIKKDGVDLDFNTVLVHERQFGYIQQQSLLFEHLSVLENLIYNNKVGEVLLSKYIKMFELEPHLHKKAGKLSGGEAQRVSIVRTLMTKPQLLLFDEAFSALDKKLRLKLRNDLKQLKTELNIPIIFITHDLNEAYELGDEIIVIEKGKIIEMGSSRQLFEQCKYVATAKLMGIANIFTSEQIKSELFETRELSNSEAIAIKATQISLEATGVEAKIGDIKLQLDVVVIELRLDNLTKPLIMNISHLEYHKQEIIVGQVVYIKIHQVIYLEKTYD